MVPRKASRGDPEGPFKGREGGGTQRDKPSPQAPSREGNASPLVGTLNCCGKRQKNSPHRADRPAGNQDRRLLMSSRK